MLARITAQIANDRLAAVLTALGAAALFGLYLYGGLEPEQAAEVKGLSEALGAFTVLALGRDRHERGKAEGPSDEPVG